MRKRGKSRKDSMLDRKNGNDNEELPNAEKGTNASSQNSPATTEDENVFPEQWKNIPFEDLKMEGWRPRIKKKGDKTYLTMRRTWLNSDHKIKNIERGMGVFSEQRWKLLQDLLLDQVPLEEETDNSEDVPTQKLGSHIKISTIESARKLTQPPGWTGRGTKILQSAVAQHINIPNKFYYDTDILEFYEYFKNRGYKGNIVDWMHECVRNYLIEHHYKVGVIFEKGISSNG